MTEVTTPEETQDLPDDVGQEIESVRSIARVPSSRIRKNHPEEGIISNFEEGICTRNTSKVNYQDLAGFVCFNSTIEPKNIKEALQD